MILAAKIAQHLNQKNLQENNMSPITWIEFLIIVMATFAFIGMITTIDWIMGLVKEYKHHKNIVRKSREDRPMATKNVEKDNGK
jgi:hypothetical protein